MKTFKVILLTGAEITIESDGWFRTSKTQTDSPFPGEDTLVFFNGNINELQGNFGDQFIAVFMMKTVMSFRLSSAYIPPPPPPPPPQSGNILHVYSDAVKNGGLCLSPNFPYTISNEKRIIEYRYKFWDYSNWMVMEIMKLDQNAPPTIGIVSFVFYNSDLSRFEFKYFNMAGGGEPITILTDNVLNEGYVKVEVDALNNKVRFYQKNIGAEYPVIPHAEVVYTMTVENAYAMILGADLSPNYNVYVDEYSIKDEAGNLVWGPEDFSVWPLTPRWNVFDIDSGLYYELGTQ